MDIEEARKEELRWMIRNARFVMPGKTEISFQGLCDVIEYFLTQKDPDGQPYEFYHFVISVRPDLMQAASIVASYGKWNPAASWIQRDVFIVRRNDEESSEYAWSAIAL